MHHSENEEIYHPNFACYVERSSSMDINPKSYYLTAFELINQPHYITFPSFECSLLKKDLSCRRLLHCDFVTSLLSRNAAHTYTYTRACAADYVSSPRQASGPAWRRGAITHKQLQFQSLRQQSLLKKKWKSSVIIQK